jgi:hypothetical protein
VNGQPAIVATREGRMFAVLVLDVEQDGRVRRLYSVVNPDKLRSILTACPQS